MSRKKIKKISTFQLLTLIVCLILFGAFVLVSSGLFDSAAVNAKQHTHSNNNLSSSSKVDLDKLAEINNLEKIVNSNSENHEALLKLGHMLNDNGYYERAIVKYEDYLKTHSENADVIVDMGVCYFELKKYDKSIDVIKSALQINPLHQIANFNLGIVNLANNNIAEAKKWWKEAREIDPNTNIGKKAEELLKSNN